MRKAQVISPWSSYAGPKVWMVMGRKKDVEDMGIETSSQVGNILGWIRDRGEHDLARDIRERIVEYNEKANKYNDLLSQNLNDDATAYLELEFHDVVFTTGN